MYEYEATVLKVHDGDTITVSMDLGMRVSYGTKIRVLGINAPELSSSNPAGAAAKATLLGLLGTHTAGRMDAVTPVAVWLRTVVQPSGDLLDKYGRLLAWIWTDEAGADSFNVEASVNVKMWRAGQARKYLAPANWPVS